MELLTTANYSWQQMWLVRTNVTVDEFIWLNLTQDRHSMINMKIRRNRIKLNRIWQDLKRRKTGKKKRLAWEKIGNAI